MKLNRGLFKVSEGGYCVKRLDFLRQGKSLEFTFLQNDIVFNKNLIHFLDCYILGFIAMYYLRDYKENTDINYVV